jgi:hypothetical protein
MTDDFESLKKKLQAVVGGVAGMADVKDGIIVCIRPTLNR